jgi:predicted ATPase
MSSSGPEWNLSQIFGREQEAKRLNDLAQESSGAFVVLHGTAGSGKSSLLRSQPWSEKGWLLASGKFEEHRSAEPFSAVIDALNQLVDMWVENNSLAQVCQMGGFKQLLQEDIEFLRNILPKALVIVGCCAKDTWKKKRDSFGSMQPANGAVDCVNASFMRILSFLCKPQPVVLFLDDIHWADKASLEVLKVLATSGQVEGLLLAVSYRDEEVDDYHAVSSCLKEINTSGGLIHNIHVTDLDVENVNRMVASVTQRQVDETMELAEVIHKKTAGNPFFVLQFLQMLRQENFLSYSFSTYRWEWGDVENLQTAAHVSDNVADVVAATMRGLPEATRCALKVSSCLGKIMPLHVLIEYFEYFDASQSGSTCHLGLHQIQMRGLHNVLESAVKIGILIKPEGADAYMWSHDKLQHVAYSLIPEVMRPSLHIRLGKLLWKMSKENPDEEWMLFMAADQLNRFSDFQQDEVLGAEVAELCLEAAKLSLSKSALYPALDMLLAGVKHLDSRDRWSEHYDLSLEMFGRLAQIAYQIGNHDDAVAAVKEVDEHARTLEDKFRAQCTMLKYTASGKDRNYALGVEKTLEVLKMYGEKIPTRLYPGQLFAESRKLRARLPGHRLEGLLELPTMVDEKAIKVTALLILLFGVAHLFGRSNHLSWFAAVRAIKISCKKGVCEETAFAVIGLAIQLRLDGHYQEANEYAELAIKLIGKFPQKLGSRHAAVISMAAGEVFSASRPFNDALDLWLEAHHIALRTGDTEKAAISILGYSYTYFCVGLPLKPLKLDLVAYGQEARQFNMPYTVQVVFLIVQQTILNLQTTVDHPTVLKGDAMDQDEVLDKLEGNGRKMTKRDIDSFRLILACVYNDWNEAEKLLDALEPFLGTDSVIARSHIRMTQMGLAALVVGRARGKKKYHSMGRKILKMYKHDLKKGAVNAHPILLMLKAEDSPSKERYNNAIKACARLGLIHHEAYMCERTGLWFLEQNDEGWAEFYLAQAYVLYGDWGATGKANQMKEDHQELLKSSSLGEKANSALKGRSRYSSEHADLLKEVTWSRLSSNGSSGRHSAQHQQ